MGNTESKNKIEVSKDEYMKYLKYKNSNKKSDKKSILKKSSSYNRNPTPIVDQYTHEYHYTTNNNSNKMNDLIYFNNRQNFNPSITGINSVDTRQDDRYNNNLDQALEQQKSERGLDFSQPQAFDSNPYEYQIPFEQTSLNGACNSLQKPLEHTNNIVPSKHQFTEKQQLGMINNQVNFNEIDPLGLLKTEKLDMNALIDKYKSLRRLYSNGDKDVYNKINIALLKLLQIRQYAVKKS